LRDAIENMVKMRKEVMKLEEEEEKKEERNAETQRAQRTECGAPERKSPPFLQKAQKGGWGSLKNFWAGT
jgi:hypothetical protein